MLCQELRDGGFRRDLPAPVYEPAREGAIRQSVADTTKSAADLNFRAAINLEEGLRRLLSEQYGLSFGSGPRDDANNDIVL